jgi:hypothetical protein
MERMVVDLSVHKWMYKMIRYGWGDRGAVPEDTHLIQ